jgi:hypothetical protein
MLIFVKVVPLPHEQDYAFFASMEKIDGESEVVCSNWGEVLGAGKLFTRVLGLNGSLLQELQPNIQILMPFVFEYFLEYYFPKNCKLKNNKRNYEVRREGYFPENLEPMLAEMSYDRTLFRRNHSSKGSFSPEEYLNFVRQKMQELTCSVSGQYVSFLVSLFRVIPLQREKRDILCLKFTNPKKDNI